MREVTGDLWDYVEAGWVVVPMTLVVLDDKKAVMPVGIAGQAVQRYPSLDRVAYGLLVDHGQRPILHCVLSWDLTFHPRLILFPTRDHSASRADVTMMRKNLRSLVKLPIEGPIYLPLLGCGYGRLDEKDVLPMMHEILDTDRYTLVRRGPEIEKKYARTFRPAGSTRLDRSIEKEKLVA